MNLQAETDFFHDIAAKVRNLVLSFNGTATIAQYKKIIGDYATEVDIAVEELIVNEIQKRFPGDPVLAEERHSEVAIPKGRIWIIDPICGTTNLGRGLNAYCTNIALANNHSVIASCVVDHSQNNYLWSVGNHELYINDRLFHHQMTEARFGVVVDVDFGSLGKVSQAQKKKHSNATFKLSLDPSVMLRSLSSSLGFAYTAIDTFDGFINVFNHPWDICAASFLIQQSGGIITDLHGNPWQIVSVGAIGANSKATHKKLLDAYTAG